jgi:hypothetical protein
VSLFWQSILVSLLWQKHYGVITLAKAFWCHYSGKSILVSLLWQKHSGVITLAEAFWCHYSGKSILVSLLWQKHSGFITLAKAQKKNSIYCSNSLKPGNYILIAVFLCLFLSIDFFVFIWLRYARSREAVGSIPGGVIGIFH